MSTRRKRRPKRLFWQILLRYGLISAALVCALSMVVLMMMSRYTRAQAHNDLAEKATLVARTLPAGWDSLSAVINLAQTEQLIQANILLLNADMRMLYGSPEVLAAAQGGKLQLAGVNRDAFRAILEGGDGRVFTMDTPMGRMLTAALPLYDMRSQRAGLLLLLQPVSRVDRAVNILLSTMLRIAAAAMLVTVLVSVTLARSLTRPMVRMSQAAQQMARGNYDVRVEGAPSSELGALSESLNGLARELKTVISNLRDERQKLQGILLSMEEGILACDSAGAIVQHNPTLLRLLDVPAGDEAALHAALAGAPLMQALYGAAATGQSQHCTYEWAGRVLQCRCNALRSGGGAVAVVRDISQSERLERMRRDYVANVSHELRTPLTGIKGLMEPLVDGVISDPADVAESYRSIYAETVRLERLIQEMLDLSGLQDGNVRIELEPMPLRAVLQGAMGTLRHRAHAAGITLAADLPADLPAVQANEARLVQVLVILLDNALSFTPPGGAVNVYAALPADQPGLVRVGVRDTGSGIAPDMLPRIWERFFKADQARTGSSGTGLGLSIARRIVELMGGAMDVRSQPGQGSDFYFTLHIAGDAPGR